MGPPLGVYTQTTPGRAAATGLSHTNKHRKEMEDMANDKNMELTRAELLLVPASRHWGMLLTLGILMIVLGTIGFFQPMAYTLATVVFFGALLLVAGGAGLVSAFRLDGWAGKASGILLAALFVLTGALMIMHPILSGLSLTLVAASFLIAAGAAKCWMGFSHRERRGWGWIALNGGLSILLGVLIFGGFPGSGLWIIGLFLAVELMFDGWGAVAIAFAAREVAERLK
jgi:uncharacterized membrane protein HdeD (DUF308 family)